VQGIRWAYNTACKAAVALADLTLNPTSKNSLTGFVQFWIREALASRGIALDDRSTQSGSAGTFFGHVFASPAAR
jgi:hypothetical protein